ncbi:hypothetical protein ASPZODRAFT_109673 [Penicilliopsis zonata CBS 506.65]|uniref:Uncharacterized protein n=1 Tax=Penicilliopsis zonata CBS 506.65 TaxID=1073090 RepID=A0A1L9SRQ9_9EURO|nr:hypothetical protein ASPZODRAFT_109673 [Penicilliopsis zonata CBS 506.65]OJJ49858.1 hypothetical protein ASPZODRAFT_109673 [Penicilliopsis zonata CBS 506.65]
MSQSSNRDDFFQTTASLEEQKRKDAKAGNTHGRPVNLQSKILALRADPGGARAVFVAQSGGTVRRVLLETGETTTVYKGPTAPLTSLCFSEDGKLVFAGCWDKKVWSWEVDSGRPMKRYEGHTDFVKAVVTARVAGEEVLVSGGADAQIIIFNIASGQRLAVHKGHARGIQDLVLDPLSLEVGAASKPVVVSAGSDREIRRFDLSLESSDQTALEPLLAHETSVYRLFFDADGDLWTASADKTSKCLVRDDEWKPNLVLEHPDFVRDVVVYEAGGWVVTACRDEEVRVWSRSTGELYHTFSGHFEEVTSLAFVGSTIVSAGIDGTVRQWSLRPDELRLAVEQARKPPVEEENKPGDSLLTEEEERELAELLEDD